MLAFVRKYQITLTCCFCVVLSLYVLSASARGQLKNDPIGPILLWILRPLQIVAHSTTGLIQGVQENYLTLTGYKAENEKLKQRITQLELERNRFLEAEATNSR